jgi:ribosomal protein L29
MKFLELKQKSKEEVERIAKELREKLRQLRFDIASGKNKNVADVKKIKKEIAQMLTFLCQRNN